MRSDTRLSKAKSKLIVNVSTNFLSIFISSIAGLLLTPYLIHTLGVAVYGMIPLFSSIVTYLGLFTTAITSSLARYSSISIGKEEYREANLYFSTAITALLVLSTIIISLGALAITHLDEVIQIPSGYESDSKALLLLIVISFCVAAISTPFSVSALVNHRFDLINYVNIFSKILQPVLLVLMFTMMKPLLAMVGISYFAANAATLILFVVISMRLTPYLRYSPARFDLECFKNISGMSAWTTIDHVGALLYLSIDLVLINTFLGATEGGFYAPFVQLVMLMTLTVDALSRVFTPVAYELVAAEDLEGLALQARRSIRFLGLGIALPAALLCGFAEPVLLLWLGPDFQQMSALVWILIAPSVFIHPFRPLFAVQRGLNKVKIPALATLTGGIFNLAMTIVLINYTPLGIYGVGIATCLSLVLKNLVFTPIYSSLILKKKARIFYGELWPGAVSGIVTFLAIYGIVEQMGKVGYLELIAGSILTLPLYGFFVYTFLLKEEDRHFIVSLLKLKRAPNATS